MRYGIVTFKGGEASGEIVGWKTNADGSDRTWDDYGAALEANDIEYGWTGYVRCYPTGETVKVNHNLR